MCKYCKDCNIKNKYIEDKLIEIKFLRMQIDSLTSIIESFISKDNIKVVVKK